MMSALLTVCVASSCNKISEDTLCSVRVSMDNDYTLPWSRIAIPPYNYRVLYYDKNTGAKAFEDFCPEKGGSMGVIQGRFSVFAYGLDMAATLVDGTDYLSTVNAYSEPVLPALKSVFTDCKSAIRTKAGNDGIVLCTTKGYPGFEDDNVVCEPDPIFAGYTKDVTVKWTGEGNVGNEFTVSTRSRLCQSSVIIEGVTNIDRLSSVQLFFTNYASSRNIFSGKPGDELATISVSASEIGEKAITACFNHFGVPQVADVVNTVYVVFTNRSGESFLFVEDVTSQVRDGDGNESLSLSIDFDVPLSENDGTGGFMPVLSDWSALHYSVPIGY